VGILDGIIWYWLYFLGGEAALIGMGKDFCFVFLPSCHGPGVKHDRASRKTCMATLKMVFIDDPKDGEASLI
jgi:hypothetical protein